MGTGVAVGTGVGRRVGVGLLVGASVGEGANVGRGVEVEAAAGTVGVAAESSSRSMRTDVGVGVDGEAEERSGVGEEVAIRSSHAAATSMSREAKIVASTRLRGMVTTVYRSCMAQSSHRQSTLDRGVWWRAATNRTLRSHAVDDAMGVHGTPRP